MANPFDDILPQKGSKTAVLEPPVKQNPFDDIILPVSKPSQPVGPVGPTIPKKTIPIPSVFKEVLKPEETAPIIPEIQAVKPEMRLRPPTPQEALRIKETQILKSRAWPQKPLKPWQGRLISFFTSAAPTPSTKEFRDLYPGAAITGKAAQLIGLSYLTGGVTPAIAQELWKTPLALFPKLIPSLAHATQSGVTWGLGGIIDVMNKEPSKETITHPLEELAFGSFLGTAYGVEGLMPRLAAGAIARGGWTAGKKLLQNKKIEKRDLVDIGLNAALGAFFNAINASAVSRAYKQARMDNFLLNKLRTKFPNPQEAEEYINLMNVWAKAAQNPAYVMKVKGVPLNIGSMAEETQIKYADEIVSHIVKGEPVEQAIKMASEWLAKITPEVLTPEKLKVKGRPLSPVAKPKTQAAVKAVKKAFGDIEIKAPEIPTPEIQGPSRVSTGAVLPETVVETEKIDLEEPKGIIPQTIIRWEKEGLHPIDNIMMDTFWTSKPNLEEYKASKKEGEYAQDLERYQLQQKYSDALHKQSEKETELLGDTEFKKDRVSIYDWYEKSPTGFTPNLSYYVMYLLQTGKEIPADLYGVLGELVGPRAGAGIDFDPEKGKYVMTDVEDFGLPEDEIEYYSKIKDYHKLPLFTGAGEALPPKEDWVFYTVKAKGKTKTGLEREIRKKKFVKLLDVYDDEIALIELPDGVKREISYDLTQPVDPEKLTKFEKEELEKLTGKAIEVAWKDIKPEGVYLITGREGATPVKEIGKYLIGRLKRGEKFEKIEFIETIPKTEIPEEIPKPTKKSARITTIGGMVKSMGGIDPEKAKLAGYPLESFKQFGALYVLRKGGQSPDEIAQELISMGQLRVEGDESPSDVLLKALQSKEKSIEYIERQVDKEIAQEEQDEQFLKQIREYGGSPEEIRRAIDIEINSKDPKEIAKLLKTKSFTDDSAAEKFASSIEDKGGVTYLEYTEEGKPTVKYILPEDIKIPIKIPELEPIKKTVEGITFQIHKAKLLPETPYILEIIDEKGRRIKKETFKYAKEAQERFEVLVKARIEATAKPTPAELAKKIFEPKAEALEYPKEKPLEWKPLYTLLKGKDKYLSQFMFMEEGEREGRYLYSYKHRDTRRYLHIDKEGNIWRYKGVIEGKPGEKPISLHTWTKFHSVEEALKYVFETEKLPTDLKEATEKPEALSAKIWEVEMPKEPAGPETINKTEIITWAEKTFKIPIKGKATHRFQMAGMYYPKEEIIRLRKWGELETMMHEIAHHLDAKVTKALGKKWRGTYIPYGEKRKAVGELASLDYNKKRRATKEGFAEYMRYYLTTDLAGKKAPTFHKYFTSFFLDANPDINARLNELKSKIDIWQKQGAENRVIEQVDFTGEHTTIGGVVEKLEKAKDWILKNWNDEFYLLQKIEDEMGLRPGTGEKLRPTQDPFTLAVYSKSKSGVIARTFVLYKAIDETGNPVGPALVEILKPIPNKQMKQFIAYGIAKRAIGLHERGIESGVDIDDAKYIVEKFKSDTWDKALNEVTVWNNHLLDWVVKAGGLGSEEAKLIRELNPVYMPFKRAFIDEIQVIRGAGGMVNKGQTVKPIKGSGRPIINPIEAMIGQATEFISKSQKVRIAKAVADLAEKQGVGGFITEVPAPMEATTFTLERLKSSLEQLGIDLGEADLDSILTVFTQSWQYRGKDNVVSIWKDGKRRFYEIHPDLYRAISGVDQMQVGPILKLLSPFAKLRRLGATGLRFAFGLARNPFRDAYTYAVFSKRKFATVFDPVAGVYKEITAKPGDIAWRFKFGGGSLGGMMGFDRAARMDIYDEMLLEKLGPLGKTLKVCKHPVDSLRGALSFWELAPRTMEVEGMYNKYKKEHPDWSEEDWFIQAFNDAQDVTVNFTKSGYYAKRINSASAFFNVAIRGPEKLFREIRENPIGVIIKGLLWLTLPTILLWYRNRKKQWYRNLPPSYKYNNFFFEMPDGTIIRLPIPFELGILFASLPLAALDTMIEKDPAYVEGLMQQIRMQVPDPTPTLLEPLIEVAKNKDFLGRPIESEGMKFLPTTERSRYYTTEIAKQLSKGFNTLGIEVSPMQIDFLLNSYTGGGIQQFPLRPIKEKADIPVLGEVLQRMPERPQRQLNSFFSDYERLSQRKQAEIANREELDKLRGMQYYYTRLIKWHFKDLRDAEKKKDLGKTKKIYERIQKELDRAGYD